MLNRLANTIANREDKSLAPILVRCREHAANPEPSATEIIQRSIASQFDLRFARRQVEYLLAVGRAFVIFDGIDEITEIPQRRKLIRSIELLASAYPLASVICTSRKVGYENAHFLEGRFPTFDLQEFSSYQVEEYAARWFSAMGRSRSDVVGFLNESSEVHEIRRNPLMLSLLCALYKIRGYIPMNQRDVYRQCADLLFHTWDSLRHIPQPVDHKRYGHSLMEELASFFYKFPPSGSGIEEKQLTGLVATFFADTAAVNDTDAKRRAREFLNYCAGRAWLLSAVGTSSRGDRLFSFTHRTFMEYYASEAIVRRSSSREDVLNAILDAYGKNPSAVLPDLIVQASGLNAGWARGQATASGRPCRALPSRAKRNSGFRSPRY